MMGRRSHLECDDGLFVPVREVTASEDLTRQWLRVFKLQLHEVVDGLLPILGEQQMMNVFLTVLQEPPTEEASADEAEGTGHG